MSAFRPSPRCTQRGEKKTCQAFRVVCYWRQRGRRCGPIHALPVLGPHIWRHGPYSRPVADPLELIHGMLERHRGPIDQLRLGICRIRVVIVVLGSRALHGTVYRSSGTTSAGAVVRKLVLLFLFVVLIVFVFILGRVIVASGRTAVLSAGVVVRVLVFVFVLIFLAG